jgi:penicillin-binding protein 2
VELQRYVEKALREGMRTAKSPVGVAIAMDPRTGQVLALVSLPSYDSNLFSGGISYSDYAVLSADPNHPLFNHAISGLYPPGSTFKIVSATAILAENIVDQTTMLFCPGTLYLPNKYAPDDPTKAQPFNCWYRRGHGELNVLGALIQSCNIYFGKAVGGYGDLNGLGYPLLARYAHELGFGEPTGIDLSGEAPGLIPDDAWKRANYEEDWVTGDSYNAAIGQGFILATPLQMLSATCTVANGGTVLRPQVVYQVTDSAGQVEQGFAPVVAHMLDVPSEKLELVRRGMLEAVQYGTAWLARVPGLTVAGKTGTAEFGEVDDKGNRPSHAWFTCFAPYEDPEIAVVVFLQGGGEGSQTAAPVAAEILRYYFGLNQPQATPSATTSG